MSKHQEKREEGATMVEYALLVALIAIAAILSLNFLGGNIAQEFSDVGGQVNQLADGN